MVLIGDYGNLNHLRCNICLSESVKGKLCACIDFWCSELCASPWILDTIMNRYVLPFVSKPTKYYHNNQHSALIEEKLVDGAVHTGGWMYCKSR